MNKILLFTVLFGMCFGAFASADDSLSSAFKNCVNQSVQNNQVTLEKHRIDGTSDSILTIPCNNAPAEVLFNAVGRYSREEQKYWADGSLAISRFFGEGNRPSQCNRRIRSAQGLETNDFWCSIKIDIVSSIIEAL